MIQYQPLISISGFNTIEIWFTIGSLDHGLNREMYKGFGDILVSRFSGEISIVNMW